MPNVVFIIRNDAYTKGGGDIDLAKQYAALIENSDSIITSIARFSEFDLAFCDLVVLFNIDMPFENYRVAQECERRKIPYVIYTLHPKAGHVEDFLRHGTIRAQYIAAFFSGFSLLSYETIACVVRLIKSGRWRMLLSYRTARYSARYVLSHAAKVLVSCTSEADYIRGDFGVDARFEVIPHLVSQAQLKNNEVQPQHMPKQYILCAGRIEPRKNQMTVVEIAKSCPDLTFLFLGKKNLNHRHYVQNFEKAVAEASNIIWRDQVPLSELHRLIGSAKAYINLSWFEVFSLIDLMSLTTKTPSILSTGSYLYDQVRSAKGVSGVDFVDPNDANAARIKLMSLSPEANVPQELFMDEGWAESAIKTKWIDTVNNAIKKVA